MNLETFLNIMNIPLNLSVDEILDMLIMYLRKSRKDMDYYKDEPIEKTLQRHEKELQEFIVSILGKPIPEYNIYREVVSGDTIDDRPVMQEVLSIIEEPKYKGVVCIETERLARGNTLDQGVIAQTFQYTSTKIITPFKIYNLDNEDDLSYFEDGLYQARKYLKYTKRTLTRGRIRSVKDGKYIGSVLPYGFNKIKIPNEKGYMLVENETEAKIIRLMADLFINGLNTTYTVLKEDNVTSIAKTFGTHKKNIITNNLDLKIGYEIKLTVNNKSIKYYIKENDTLESIAKNHNISIKDIHIPNDIFKPGETLKIILTDMRAPNIAHYLNYLKVTPRKAKIWTDNMVRNILQSYTIYGNLTWEKRKTTKTLINGKVVKTNPKSNNFLVVEGRHEAILNKEMESKIKQKFADNRLKTVPDKSEIKNPLVGLIKCHYCGSNMTRRPYQISKEAKTTPKRIYDLDKKKLRLLLREHKGNYSLNDIAKKINVPRSTIEHWFANNDERFLIPYAHVWFDLKKLLNIKTTEFDLVITTIEEKITPAHVDALMCRKARCKCVASDLNLVEERLLKSLKLLLTEYMQYVDNYQETVKKEISNNKELIEIIDREVEKTKFQIDKACELVETGVYTQDLFISRTRTLNEQLNNLMNQKTELSKSKDITKKFNSRKKTIPIIEDVLTKYNDELTPEEKNQLLKIIIKEVIYKKDKGGKAFKDNFTLKVILQPFD